MKAGGRQTRQTIFSFRVFELFVGLADSQRHETAPRYGIERIEGTCIAVRIEEILHVRNIGAKIEKRCNFVYQICCNVPENHPRVRQARPALSSRAFYLRCHSDNHRFPRCHAGLPADAPGSRGALGERRLVAAGVCHADGARAGLRFRARGCACHQKGDQRPCLPSQDARRRHRSGHGHIRRGLLAQLGLRPDRGGDLRQRDRPQTARRGLPLADCLCL